METYFYLEWENQTEEEIQAAPDKGELIKFESRHSVYRFAAEEAAKARYEDAGSDLADPALWPRKFHLYDAQVRGLVFRGDGIRALLLRSRNQEGRNPMKYLVQLANPPQGKKPAFKVEADDVNLDMAGEGAEAAETAFWNFTTGEVTVAAFPLKAVAWITSVPA